MKTEWETDRDGTRLETPASLGAPASSRLRVLPGSVAVGKKEGVGATK